MPSLPPASLRAFTAIVLGGALVSGSVFAQEAAAPPAAATDPLTPTTTYSLELNKLEVTDGACSGYFIFRNGSDTQLAQAHVQLFVFDASDQVMSAFTIAFTDVRPMSEKVGVFEVKPTDCSGIGRILVNEIRECQGPDNAAVPRCAAEFSAVSRATVPMRY